MGKKKPAKIHTLFLFTGYVESNSNACLVAHHSEGFDTLKDALKDLAELMVKPVIDEETYKAEKKICKCGDTSDKKFCPECGKPKKAEIEPMDKDTVEGCANDFIHGDADSTGYMWEYIEESGWSFGGQAISREFLSEGVVLVYESAENLLAAAYTDSLKEGKARDGSDHYFSRPEEHSKKIC